MPKTKKLAKREREKLVKEATKLVEEMGKQALYEARKQVLQDIRKLKSKQLKGAIRHMIKKRWKDYSRPALMMMVCEAVGGDPELTKEIAKALILIAAAIDLHDDLVDKSTIKHGEPTTLGMYGPEITLLVGDVLYVEGFAILCKALLKYPDKVSELIELIKEKMIELGDAEALEYEAMTREDIISPREYLKIVHHKAADAELYLALPAIVAGVSSQVLERLLRAGRELGEIVILLDDLEDLDDLAELKHRMLHEIPPLPTLIAIDRNILSFTLARGRDSYNDDKIQELARLTKKSQGFSLTRGLILKKIKRLEKLISGMSSKIKTNKLIIISRSLFP